MKPPKTRLCALWLAFALGACLVDLDERCSEHQLYDAQNARCSCEDGFGLVDQVCVACDANEVTVNGVCECAPGFARKQEGGACEENAALGAACNDDSDCTSEEYPGCRFPAGSGEGYCTSLDCESSADCHNDYGCNTREDPSYCEQPPSGLGAACSSSDDCADFDAAFCESVVAKACVVSDCKSDPDKCHGDWVCCDIALLGDSLCVPPTQLEQGNCPAGGELIPRSP
jgi:hypothetical protein